MPDTGITVIGGGGVGLAIAARLAPRHPDLVVLERRPRHGQETSSRNSEHWMAWHLADAVAGEIEGFLAAARSRSG